MQRSLKLQMLGAVPATNYVSPGLCALCSRGQAAPPSPSTGSLARFHVEPAGPRSETLLACMPARRSRW